MKNILKLIVISLLMSACADNNTQITDKTGKKLQTGKIYNNIKGENDTTLNYTLYVPANFDGKNALPVIYFLDPHAQGYLPVEKYSKLADKYNYILVGSNVSRNGMSVNEFDTHFKSLLSEITNRYPVNKNRMFTAGFSGGAKMAVICAEKYPEIIGVSACGGVTTNAFSGQPNYYFAGIIGDKDFNYLEMRQHFNLFDSYGFDYTATTFKGTHQWAPTSAFETAFIGFDIFVAKKEGKQLSENFIKNLSRKINDSVALYQKQNRKIDEYEILQQQNRWYYGLLSVADVQKQIAEVMRTQDFRKEIESRKLAFRNEVKLRVEFIKALEKNNVEWWKTELQKINKKTGNREIDLVKHRLLNYVSMASYMLIKTNLESDDMEKAKQKLEIYKLIDPQNADVDLLYAQWFLQNNELDKMKNCYASAKQKDEKIYIKNINYPFWKKLLNMNE